MPYLSLAMNPLHSYSLKRLFNVRSILKFLILVCHHGLTWSLVQAFMSLGEGF